jgi:hypothetical protein
MLEMYINILLRLALYIDKCAKQSLRDMLPPLKGLASCFTDEAFASSLFQPKAFIIAGVTSQVPFGSECICERYYLYSFGEGAFPVKIQFMKDLFALIPPLKNVGFPAHFVKRFF